MYPAVPPVVVVKVLTTGPFALIVSLTLTRLASVNTAPDIHKQILRVSGSHEGPRGTYDAVNVWFEVVVTQLSLTPTANVAGSVTLPVIGSVQTVWLRGT